MRITSGKYKNRKIDARLPKGQKPTFRPTQSKTRTAVLNKLSFSRVAFEGGITNRNILDVFCGCGTFGLEALSRDAGRVGFIDKVQDNIKLAQKNATTFGANDQCDFFCLDATALTANRRNFRYDIVYMDPPYYNNNLILKTLEALHAGGWLAEECLIVIEVAAKQTIALPTHFTAMDESIHGASKVIYAELERK